MESALQTVEIRPVRMCTENIFKNGVFRKHHHNHVISLTKFSSNTNPKSPVNDAFSNFSGVMWKAPHFSSSSHSNCVLTCFVLLFLNLSLKHLLSRTNSSKPILKTKQWTGFLIYLQNNKQGNIFFINYEVFIISSLPKTLDFWSVNVFFSTKSLVLDRGIVAFVCLWNQQHVELL